MEHSLSKVVTVIVILVVLTVINVCGYQSYNILYISSVASPSHFLWSEQLSKIIARAGHNVTLLNIFKEGRQENLHFMKLNEVDEYLALDDPIDYLELHRLSQFELQASFLDLEITVCHLALTSNQFVRLMGYPKKFKFDLIIHDHAAGPCLLLLMERFNHPPLIMASASDVLQSTEHFFGSPMFPGLIPNQFTDLSITMGYIERVYNFIVTFLESMSRKYHINPRIDQIVKNYYPNMSSVSHLEMDTAVVLLNSIAILSPPEPKLWRVINVGGLHIETPRPRQGKSYLMGLSRNASFEKCVYVSFGSNIQIMSVENPFAQSLIAVARQLPSVMFLWKINQLDGVVPENVFIADWFPQNDILGSGKIDAFVTHGGLLSVQEAAWYGVPMLGIPNYGDQYQNVRRIVRLGAGKRLNLEDVSPEVFKEHLMELIHEERYRRSARILSQIIRDVQVPSQITALWTIEWVIRNQQNTESVMGDFADVPFHAKYSFDILFTILLAIGLIASTFNFFVCFGFRYCMRSFKKKTKHE